MKEFRKWLDEQSYKDLLQRWRFAPIGDPIFQGATGKEYAESMSLKKQELSHKEQVRISKEVGW